LTKRVSTLRAKMGQGLSFYLYFARRIVSSAAVFRFGKGPSVKGEVFILK
jgi:hypothetical protein